MSSFCNNIKLCIFILKVYGICYNFSSFYILSFIYFHHWTIPPWIQVNFHHPFLLIYSRRKGNGKETGTKKRRKYYWTSVLLDIWLKYHHIFKIFTRGKTVQMAVELVLPNLRTQFLMEFLWAFSMEHLETCRPESKDPENKD